MSTTQLHTHAVEIRKNIVKMVHKTQGSHIGCSLGIVDILVALYFDTLKINPKNPNWQKRDRFLLSKGHACTALYATLAQRGFFPKKRLDNFCVDGSPIAAHVTLGSLPGIEATAGSLGHGLSMGIGMAIATKNNGLNCDIYVLVGDAECQEGSVWEALLFAGHHKIHNLVLIIDNNNLQTLDSVTEILTIEPIDRKLRAFRWQTIAVDGHDINRLINAFKTPHPDKPLAIIAKTIKGKGVSFMEDDLVWHGRSPNKEEYVQAIHELEIL